MTLSNTIGSRQARGFGAANGSGTYRTHEPALAHGAASGAGYVYSIQESTGMRDVSTGGNGYGTADGTGDERPLTERYGERFPFPHQIAFEN